MNVPKLRFKEFNDEYKCVEFGNIVDYQKGFAFKSKDYCNKGVRIIRITDTTKDSINESNGIYIAEDKAKLYSSYMLKENDIIISSVGSKPPLFDSMVGKVIIVPNHANNSLLNQNVIRFRTIKHNQLYVYNYLKRNSYTLFIESIMRGNANQRSITLEDLFKFRIFLPATIDEENKIGRFLSLLDKKIELQSKKIVALKLYKMCISKNFFDNKNLKTTLLKNICNIKKGQQLNNEYLKVNGIYYMLNGGMLPSGYTDNYNTLENTISISEGGNSCGYVNFNKEKFWSGGHCYTVEPININNEYLFQLLKYYEKAIMSLRVGSGLPNIQKKDLELFKVAIHTQDEQKNISKTLCKIDLKIDLENKKLSKLESLKKGFMQNMFV